MGALLLIPKWNYESLTLKLYSRAFLMHQQKKQQSRATSKYCCSHCIGLIAFSLEFYFTITLS